MRLISLREGEGQVSEIGGMSYIIEPKTKCDMVYVEVDHGAWLVHVCCKTKTSSSTQLGE